MIRKVSVAREGRLICGILAVCAAVAWPLSVLLGIILTGLFAFTAFFFRDPNRQVPSRLGVVLSPADGRVVSVEETYETNFLKQRCHKVSIFLSIFNVHINRAPIEGKVDYLKYEHGKFVSAVRKKASVINESNSIGIEGDSMQLLVRQIAGLIARRIVCYCEPNRHLQLGQRIGMIKFGSKVELYLPLKCRVHVKRGQRVKGGLTTIGVYDEDKHSA